MHAPTTPKPWIVALTGASGVRYGIRLLQVLGESGHEVHAIVSEAACRVLRDEDGVKLSVTRPDTAALLGRGFESIKFHDPRDIGAPLASGSFPVAGMAVVPCSMSSLAAIASGAGSHLVHRAAEVTLKEGRRLILVPRETPLSVIQLENMLKLARAGARIVPAMPGFYHRPSRIEEIVDMLVMRVLDQMEIDTSLVRRWGIAPEETHG